MPDDLVMRLLERLDAILSQQDALRSELRAHGVELRALRGAIDGLVAYQRAQGSRSESLEQRLGCLERRELASLTPPPQWPPTQDPDDDAVTEEHQLPDDGRRWDDA